MKAKKLCSMVVIQEGIDDLKKAWMKDALRSKHSSTTINGHVPRTDREMFNSFLIRQTGCHRFKEDHGRISCHI